MTRAEWAMLGFVLLIAAGIGAVVWIDQQDPVIELEWREWTCTQERVRHYERPMKIADMVVMAEHTESQCERWERRP